MNGRMSKRVFAEMPRWSVWFAKQQVAHCALRPKTVRNIVQINKSTQRIRCLPLDDYVKYILYVTFIHLHIFFS